MAQWLEWHAGVRAGVWILRNHATAGWVRGLPVISASEGRDKGSPEQADWQSYAYQRALEKADYRIRGANQGGPQNSESVLLFFQFSF